jgi:hypothetical protein
MDNSPDLLDLSEILFEFDRFIPWKEKRVLRNPMKLARSLAVLVDKIDRASRRQTNIEVIEFYKRLEKLDIPLEELKFWLSPVAVIDISLYQKALSSLNLLFTFKEIARLVLTVRDRKEPSFEEVVSLISRCQDEVESLAVLAVSGSIETRDLVNVLWTYESGRIRKAGQLLNNFEVLNLHFPDKKNNSPLFPHDGDGSVHTVIKVIRSVRNAHPARKRAVFTGVIPLLGLNGISRMFEVDKESLKELVSMHLPGVHYASEAIMEYARYLLGTSNPGRVLSLLAMSFRSRIKADPCSVSKSILDVRNNPAAVRGLAYLMCAERIVKKTDRASLEKALADVVHAVTVLPGVFPEMKTS